ncbi:MAG: HD domain-containing protein [Deltaproteobacteria bacterium]|nr:HD domain-containing protein [Deltaproteobacteria bacterium]
MSRTLRRDQIPEPVVEIVQKLRDAGFRAWVVGGCLRDLLLGKEVSDWDIATSALPKDVKGVFRRVIPTGIEHGTVTVLYAGGAYELTTLRGEGAYSDGRRPDEVFFVDDIGEDLARRDFTVNAVAFDPTEGNMVDPYGGIADLGRRVIRAVGEPAERFGEDGLRVLRAARFVATLEFELDPATEAAIGAQLDTFAKVSKERVRDEWLKTMKAKRPSRAFEAMRRTGILGVTCPTLLEQVGCDQNQWHNHDVWGHTMETLDASDGNAIDRIAALLHDIGKPETRAHSDKTNDWTFYNHERVGAKMADRWLREYRFSNDERTDVVHLIRHHLICYSPAWSDAAVRRFLRRVGADHVGRLLALGRADAIGKGRPVDEEMKALAELEGRIEAVLAAGAALSTRDLHVNGKDVMERLGVPGGPVIGRVLGALLDHVTEDPSINDRDQLLELIDDLGEQGEASP